jgi:hypothetical protein
MRLYFRLLLLLFAFWPFAAQSGTVEFNRDIRPILSDKCFHCHGFDPKTREAGLRLDEREAAIEEKDGIRAIVPGKPDESEMILRIFSADADEAMPPPDSNKKLTPEQKETLKRWIAEGAPYEPHWAYREPKRPEVPQGRTAIDALIGARLAERGIQPSAEADRKTLLRRLALDVTGLPPTPEEIDVFVNDPAPDAYARQVERLLASPHYGERMAVPWLDAVRYADTVGYHGDQNQRIFPYRDYVIAAFNRNLPFDQFTREQLAGDLLPNPTPEQLVASGFNRLNMMTREGGAQPKEYLAKYAADRVRTVSGAWLGSTMACAECHDHKYDPFSIKDFYRFAAFFADVKQWGVYNDYHYTPNPELKGWSNEHPFPPELQVESPYLQRREKALRQEVHKLAQRGAEAKAAEFAEWKKQATQFLGAYPLGWQPLRHEVRMTKDASKKDEKAEVQVLSAPVPPGGLAALDLTLLPSGKEGRIFAGDAAAVRTLHIEIWHRAAEGTEMKKAGVRFAGAERAEPQYANGRERLGVHAGWKLRNGQVPAVSEWLLASPLTSDAGGAIEVRIRGGRIEGARLAFSPLAPVLPFENRTLPDEALWLSSTAPGAVADLAREIAECAGGKAWTMVTEAVRQPAAMRVLPRGNWLDESGEIVEPQVPHFLPQIPVAEGGRATRLDLANWLCAPENPLTARVLMNRLWKQFFGNALSAAVEDVGAQGEWPSHPELLDWLAVEFRESGWDVKHMVREIVMSEAYRRDSNLRRELREMDPENRLLATQNPRRLDAEFVRDNALFIAGLLNREMGGPSAFPYQPPRYYESLQFPDRDYYAEKDDRQYRRGLYMHWQRTFLHPMLANFDAPSREEGACSRTPANTPQQALTLLNDPTFVEAARVFAARLLAERNLAGDGQRIDRVFRLALGRLPAERERASLLAFLEKQRAEYRERPEDAAKVLKVGLHPGPTGIEQTELAAWTGVCRVVLNLHETITRY